MMGSFADVCLSFSFLFAVFVFRVVQDADSAMNSDQNMASLIKMVSKVMDTYEGF